MQQDFAALQWVTAEIEQTASQFGVELLSFADNLSDETRLRQSLTLAHQLHATLRLLSVPSAEQLARETEQTVQAILHGRIEAAGNVVQALLAASTQLPVYLRRVAGERRELPFEVLDLVNELRELRGESPVDPPSVGIVLDPAELAEATGDASPDISEALQRQLVALSQQLHSALPDLLAHVGIHAALQGLGETAAALAATWSAGGRSRMLQAVVAFCDAVRLGGVGVDARFDACLRGLSEDLDTCVAAGPRAAAVRPSEALYRDLLAVVADSRPASGALIDIQRRYRLVPGRQAPGSSGDGQSAIVVDTAGATEIAARLAGVLQRLEGSEGDARAIARALHEVEADLRSIGAQLAEPAYREEHEMLIPQLERIAAGTIDGEGAEDRLTEITMALLEIDQRLAARIAGSGEGGESMEQRRHPLARARAALYREVQILIEQAKQALANHADASAGTGPIGELPGPLHAAAGALRLAGLDGPAAVLSACRVYAGKVDGAELPAPSSAQVEALAESLSAVEYYLERLQIDGQPTELILERVSGAVATLGGSVTPRAPAEEIPAIAPLPAPELPEPPASPREEIPVAPEESVLAAADGAPASSPPAEPQLVTAPETAAAPAAIPVAPTTTATRAPRQPESTTPQDLVALQWTVDEIERTTGRLVEELLGYADNASDPTRLRFCLTLAHQLSATLALVGVVSARRFAQEIEDTAQVMMNGTAAAAAESIQVLVTAARALPLFLRRMLAERRELPLETVPAVNSLRALRGEAMLPPPDLVGMLDLPELAEGSGEGAPAGSPEDVLLLRRARQRFQLELVGILREDRLGERMRTLGRLFRSLGEHDWGAGQRLLWETCGTLCEAVAMEGLACDDRVRSCLRDIDNELRAFIGLEAGFRRRAPSESLFRALLTALAESRPVSEPVVALQQRYRLIPARVAPEAESAEAVARESAGIAAISRELGRIFERIEGCGGDSEAIDAVLRELKPVLAHIHGLLVAGEFASEAALVGAELARPGSELPVGEAQEERLTEITMTLLEVDQRLASRSLRAGAADAASDARRHPLVLARETVCREVQAGIEQAKQAVADYTRTAEASRTLAELPMRLGGLVGALRLAGLSGAEGILAACRGYIAEVLEGRQKAPDAADVDRLADGLSSVEYFLERLLQDGEPSELILTRSRESIARLGQGAPAPSAEVSLPAPGFERPMPEPTREEWLPELDQAPDLAELGAEEELASAAAEPLAAGLEPDAREPMVLEPVEAEGLPVSLESDALELAALEPEVPEPELEALSLEPEYPVDELFVGAVTEEPVPAELVEPAAELMPFEAEAPVPSSVEAEALPPLAPEAIELSTLEAEASAAVPEAEALELAALEPEISEPEPGLEALSPESEYPIADLPAPAVTEEPVPAEFAEPVAELMPIEAEAPEAIELSTFEAEALPAALETEALELAALEPEISEPEPGLEALSLEPEYPVDELFVGAVTEEPVPAELVEPAAELMTFEAEAPVPSSVEAEALPPLAPEAIELSTLEAEASAAVPEAEALELAALEPEISEPEPGLEALSPESEYPIADLPAPAVTEEPVPAEFAEPVAELMPFEAEAPEAIELSTFEAEASPAVPETEPVELALPEPAAGVVEEPLDPEIVEIFVEEAAEVLQTIAEQFPVWRASPVPGVALTELRRAFHTLKGSGRMVGAEVIGELAWSIEHLLNRVIERAVVPGPDVVEAVEQARVLMPELVSCFAERRPVVLAPVERVKTLAAALARGESVRWEEEPPALPVRPPAVLVTEEAEELEAEALEAEALPAASELLEEVLAVPEPVLEAPELGESVEESVSLDTEALPPLEPEFPQEPVPEAIDSWQPELQPEEILASGELEEAAERLLGIFADEAAEHLGELEGWLASAAEPVVGDQTMRAVHTLKGSARVAGVAPLAELMEPLDTLVRAAGSVPRAPAAGERTLLEAVCELLRDLVAARMRVDPSLADRAAVLRDLAHALVAESATDRQAAAADEARLARFLEEALEKLFHATNLLDAWASGNEPEANRRALQGELLAIQQRTEQLGLGPLIPLSTALAAAVSRAAGEVGPDCLKQGVEAFLDALDRLAAGQQPEVPAAVVEALQGLAAEAPEAMPVPIPAGIAPEAELLRTRIARDLQQAEQDLLGIFLEEAEELMAAIDQDIDDWRHDRTNRAPFERLQRSLHTLKGGARMAGLKTLGELSHHFETFLINQSVQFGSFDDPFFLRVADLHEQLLQTMDIVRERPVLPAEAPVVPEEPAAGSAIPAASGPEAPVVAAPAVEAAEPAPPLATAREEAPAAASSADAALRDQVARELLAADPDLLGVFLEEAEELIASIDSGIDAWRGARESEAAFDQLKRDLHTLKGGARMAGIASLGELAHEFESMLIAEAARPEARDDAFFERVLGFHERLMRTMDIVRERPVPGEAPVAPAEPPMEAPPTEPAPPAPADLATLPATTPAVTPPPRMPAAPVGEAARTTVPVRDEVVRVSAQLLEDLVNLAGETSISRGRVEEQVSELGKLFDDMQGTIERLQSQVRRLDIATEAQILFRRERAESAGSEGFDPLEMDRYSQLQQLSRSLVESASDLLDIKRTLADKTRDLETVLIQQSRINSQLQEGLMRSRMVPFSSILPRVKRVVRQVASELGKSVELELGNMAGELDRGILERVVAPMEHMLRNAVDHGIESREKRLAAGKPETGRILIEIAREGGDVLISVSDDGGGVKIDAVRRKAIERGLMKPDETLSDHEIVQFILNSGFSTAEKVTQISGRGVGMDVVSSEIRQMGGSLEIRSTEGEGSCFLIRLPFTVSVSRSLMVSAGSETYALPLNTVVGVLRMGSQELARYVGPDAEPLEYAGHSYVMRHLGDLLYPGEQVDLAPTEDTVPVVLVRGGGQSIAVEVDRLVGAREVVVKSLGPQFGAVPGLSGATVLGDGSVVLILDIPAMLRADAARGAERAAATRAVPKAQADRPPLIMVVDDSVTVRKVTTRFLEREGMRVLTAKDGAEAMILLQEQVPDLMLLDIEMPHMDGFEVLSKVRLSDALRQLPVIMITSRTGEKHRERALALGANQYLGKPYQENILLEHVRALLKRRGG